MSRKKKSLDRRLEPFYDLEIAASARECTGLMPAQIQNAEQGEQLSALEGIHRIKPPDEK